MIDSVQEIGEGTRSRFYLPAKISGGEVEEARPELDPSLKIASTTDPSDEHLKYMYEVVCGGRKGGVAAIARVIKKDRAYVSKELKRIRRKKAVLGRPSKSEAAKMDRDLKEYLVRRSQK